MTGPLQSKNRRTKSYIKPRDRCQLGLLRRITFEQNQCKQNAKCYVIL
jgi:hypothetical protein